LQAQREREILTIGELQFEGINDFNYVCANINSENKADEEITKRIMAGNHVYCSLRKLLRSPFLLKGTKMTIYKMLIRPVVAYGPET
jgi:hypothetical protein